MTESELRTKEGLVVYNVVIILISRDLAPAFLSRLPLAGKATRHLTKYWKPIEPSFQ